MVWADKGANGSSNCMIGYFDGYTSGYATPMIEFVEPRQVSYLYMANSAITYPYKPTQVDEASYYYKVKITGSLEGKETGSAAVSYTHLRAHETVLDVGLEKGRSFRFG